MIPKFLFTAAALSLTLGGCATVQPQPTDLAHADIVTAEGKPAGRAYLTANGDAVTLTVQAAGLKPGLHGIHLHTVGKCEALAFTSAGGHLNPGMKMHGSMNPAGAHMGDLPNLAIAADGAGAATVFLPGKWADIGQSIFDADGSAIVIHAAEDDYKTDPTGNSGGRIACGVFVQG